jgi:mRNA interferase YafQ
MKKPDYSGQFKRDVKMAEKRGKDMEKLKTAMRMLIDETPLPASYLDHPLKGEWKGWRDLHIEPDWLLIYQLDAESVRFERTGRHVDLFGG